MAQVTSPSITTKYTNQQTENVLWIKFKSKVRNTFIQLTKPVIQSNWGAEIALALPRIFCGIVLAKDFGADKFGMPWTPVGQNLSLFEVAAWFPQDVAEFGGIFAVAPLFFAWMGAASEAIGGVFLALGLQTRIFSFLLICTMLVAIFCQQLQHGLWNMLAPMGFLWIAIYGLVNGSGKIGLDYLLAKRWKKSTPTVQ
ncbi:MAG: DoxX family protein [Saprospiraceae bacterium]|nr:DoxX family protein [Saprospiraceae bacterium]